jgi:hypothetical protein
MNNDPKIDLIYAILAMDSYNRGYGTGISALPSSGMIGNYQIIRQSDITPGSEGVNAGFYAIAYKNIDTGEVVIAYRGTDANLVSPLGAVGSDALNGYGIALGAAPGSVFDFATRQAELAAAFYTAVTGKSDTECAPNVTLTGHSLGGGLAGFINVTTGTKAVVFAAPDFRVPSMRGCLYVLCGPGERFPEAARRGPNRCPPMNPVPQAAGSRFRLPHGRQSGAACCAGARAATRRSFSSAFSSRSRPARTAGRIGPTSARTTFPLTSRSS